MEYIIKNAKIATMDKENPVAESAIVKDGKRTSPRGKRRIKRKT